jgi:carboxyl-terminal processing protease
MWYILSPVGVAMGRFKRYLIAGAVVGLGALAGALAGGRSADDASGSDAFLERYTSLLRVVQANAPQPVKSDDLVYSSIDGMLELLDPHTNFLRPEAFAQMRERQEGSFHGIGVIISLRGGKVTVITPIEGTPAARVGLRAGDIIESVDGTPTEGMNLDDVAQRLRGPEGTTVHVTIVRPGLTEPLAVDIQRARVPTESVQYAFMLGDKTAYIRISDFTRTTGKEVGRALARLQDEGATRLLLDLRANPGGIVDSAVEVAGMLLAPGQEVFSTKGRTADSFQDYRAAQDGLHFGGPVVVLVNRGTASAAEIVAGAIQDHDRGLVVGETTFGKGVVQTIFPVRDAGLALTTAKYYTPSGRCIQRDFDSFFAYTHPDSGNDEATEAVKAKKPAPPHDGQVFFTDIGRKVYGGGGIFPDEQIAQSEYSARVGRLVLNSAFFHFAVDYLADKTDKAEAARSFVADSAAVDRFRALVVDKKWMNEKDIDATLADKTDRRDIEILLKSEVLNAGVSLNAGYRVLTEADQQIQDAISYFDEASRLQARAEALDSLDRRAAVKKSSD